MDINYSLGKSIDLASRSENSANFSTDFLINSWDPHQLRAVSRFDVRTPSTLSASTNCLSPSPEVRFQHESRLGCHRGRMGDQRHVSPDLGPAVQHQRRLSLGHQLGIELFRATEWHTGSGNSQPS